MSENLQWQQLYRAAMLELDRTKLRERIDHARTAIRLRTEELARNINGQNGSETEERQGMVDALGNLQVLQQVEFRVPTISPAETERSPESTIL